MRGPSPLLLSRSVRPDSQGTPRASRKEKKRIVLTVSRKEAPLAVTRNRIRRRLRAALIKSGMAPAHAVIVIGTARVATVPFPELVQEVRRVLQRYE